jgi:hypothetical protein
VLVEQQASPGQNSRHWLTLLKDAGGWARLQMASRTRAVASLFISVSLSPAGKPAGFNLKGVRPHAA